MSSSEYTEVGQESTFRPLHTGSHDSFIFNVSYFPVLYQDLSHTQIYLFFFILWYIQNSQMGLSALSNTGKQGHTKKIIKETSSF